MVLLHDDGGLWRTSFASVAGDIERRRSNFVCLICLLRVWSFVIDRSEPSER